MQTVRIVILPTALWLHAAGDIDDHALVHVDRFVVQDHRALAIDDVVELVGPLVVVQLGIVDLHVMHFGGRAILLFDQAANLPARFGPGSNRSRVADQKLVREAVVMDGSSGMVGGGIRERTKTVVTYHHPDCRR